MSMIWLWKNTPTYCICVQEDAEDAAKLSLSEITVTSPNKVPTVNVFSKSREKSTLSSLH